MLRSGSLFQFFIPLVGRPPGLYFGQSSSTRDRFLGALGSYLAAMEHGFQCRTNWPSSRWPYWITCKGYTLYPGLEAIAIRHPQIRLSHFGSVGAWDGKDAKINRNGARYPKKLCRDGRRWKYGGWNLESSGVLESPSEKQTKEEIRSGNPINLRTMKGLKVTNSLVDSYGRSWPNANRHWITSPSWRIHFLTRERMLKSEHLLAI